MSGGMKERKFEKNAIGHCSFFVACDVELASSKRFRAPRREKSTLRGFSSARSIHFPAEESSRR